MRTLIIIFTLTINASIVFGQADSIAQSKTVYELSSESDFNALTAFDNLQGTWISIESQLDLINIKDSTWTFLSDKIESTYKILRLEEVMNYEDPNDVMTMLIICKEDLDFNKSEELKKNDDCLYYTVEVLNDKELKFDDGIVAEPRYTLLGKLRKK